MKHIKLLLVFISFILFTQSSFSQYDKQDETSEIQEEDLSQLTFKERLYFGGNLGLSFGTWTQIDISPNIGYRITNDFSAGIGVKYNYLSYNGAPSFKSTIYGGSAFGRHMIIENLYAYTELEMLNVQLNQFHYGSTERKWIPIGLIGAGYNFAPFQIIALYDLIGDKYNPYISPLGPNSRLYLKMGDVFGL